MGIEIIPKITIPRHNARVFSRVVSDRRPSMKHLSVLGAAVRSGAAVLLACAAFFMFWGLIACGVYIVAMALGFHPRPTVRRHCIGWWGLGWSWPVFFISCAK